MSHVETHTITVTFQVKNYYYFRPYIAISLK